ncbi:pyridoxal phosphate-dependent decarboxylase family protein [Egicoccus halophilus]|uniref:Aromatic-L-amino-acid decarboxylase n=1 Tax=Egicoccus halophilus TaxID=1670830 RepID=A0A8J3A7Z7_9ACTN|nr:pyridoxal-dependent decarboxylase [Egicoccus halophilus]GGI04216.1 aromatic-L-amino-acid decarboxylase [Egicoccus halophilus]
MTASAEPARDGLDPAQSGLGDMDADAFRRHGHAVVDLIADYLEGVGERPVLAQVRPGEVREALPATPPRAPEPFDAALDDLERVLLPGITHWNHPAFHAYFAITGSGPGILGEALSAALNVNGMLWRTSPSATELEELVLDWLRQLLGLPAGLRAIVTDSASMSTMLALAAAREQAGLDVRQRGLAGRADVPLLRIYTSEHAHSSVEKAAITLGLGRDGVRTVPTDAQHRLDVTALGEAVREDLRFGYRPLAFVPTVGTTSTTSIDPVGAVAELRDELVAELGHPIWLHVDGAYGGMAAICPELRWVLDGVERADSFVTNPHKWLFTPIDCSALFVREPAWLTRAFSLVPEYLTTDDEGVTDYMDWGVQLGRRFRALKLWLVIRYFGADGLAARIREHVAQAQRVVAWVEQHPDLELMAPAPLSTVCFRAAPEDLGGDEDARRRLNRAWLARINATGEAYLSHTELDGRYVLRLALGNLRTTDERLSATLAVLERELTTARAAGSGTPAAG